MEISAGTFLGLVYAALARLCLTSRSAAAD